MPLLLSGGPVGVLIMDEWDEKSKQTMQRNRGITVYNYKVQSASVW